MLRPAIAIALTCTLMLAVACGDDDEDSTDSSTGTPEDVATQPTTSTTATAELTPSDAAALQLTSGAFEDNGPIPAKYTCNGENILPPLAIAGSPASTTTFAIIVTDLDGPGGDFVHWTVWNIDGTVTEIPEGTVPQGGVEGLTGTGSFGFFGPCPPSGEHRYVFDLYALDAPIKLDPLISGKPELP
jgi:Raf kinase inhibitor-like YbhB/YbcL family protein